MVGIAAFSVGKNGISSRIAGPYYFKVMNIDKNFEQIFKDSVINEGEKKSIFINDNEYKNDVITIDTRATLRFKSFEKDSRFYFTFKKNLNKKKQENDKMRPIGSEYPPPSPWIYSPKEI